MTPIAISPELKSGLGWEVEPTAPGGIVVGVDGSPESIAAFNTASAIAAARKCAVHIVSVIPPFASYRIGPEVDQNESEIESLRINIREMAIREILEKSNPGNAWTHEVVTGRAPRAIVTAAERRNADMIVVGRRRHGPMDKLLGGETTLQVIRMSPIPVLAVQTELSGPNSVVVATDFSPSSTRVARLALELLGNQGKLYMVHVESPLDVQAQASGFTSDGRFPGDLVVWFRRQLEELPVHEGVIIETVALSGKPAGEVLDFSARVGADLIASGTHGHSRLERFLLGSVSTAIARSAVCPILVASPDSKD